MAHAPNTDRDDSPARGPSRLADHPDLALKQKRDLLAAIAYHLDVEAHVTTATEHRASKALLAAICADITSHEPRDVRRFTKPEICRTIRQALGCPSDSSRYLTAPNVRELAAYYRNRGVEL